MESRVEKALELFKSGYNCSQAVFVAYADLFGIDETSAARLSASFGGGLGGMRQTCGTVSAMSMVAGLKSGMTTPGDKAQKKVNYDTVQYLAGKFRDEYGSTRCGQLLGLEPGLPEGFKKRPCSEYVRTCATLIEEHLLADK